MKTLGANNIQQVGPAGGRSAEIDHRTKRRSSGHSVIWTDAGTRRRWLKQAAEKVLEGRAHGKGSNRAKARRRGEGDRPQRRGGIIGIGELAAEAAAVAAQDGTTG
jgi:hypothetical protein